MTTFSVTLNLSGTAPSIPNTITQNITSSDNISLTVTTPTTLFVDWFLYDIVGCSVSSTAGVRGNIITVTPLAGATSYYATFETTRFNELTQEDTYRYGKIQGTISGGGGTDTTPDQFTFTDQSNVAISSTITSNSITVTGIDTATPISVSGGTYSINGGAYTSSSGTITNGQTVSVQHTSSGTNSTPTNTTLTIGGVSDVFTSTTIAAVAPDTTPEQFTFTNVVGAALSTIYTSNPVSIFGINTGAPISVSGGTYNIDGGAFTSTAGTIVNGQIARVQNTSSSIGGTSTSTTLIIGGVSSTFTVTTTGSPDTTPDAFIFADQNDVPLSSTITSNAITVSGINAAASISVTGGTYSINGGAYTSATGSVTNGQTVSVQHTSSATSSTGTNTTLTIGGVSDVFRSFTGGASTSGTYGLQIFDSLGNITLDTTDNTIKDFGAFTISSVTTNSTITGVPLTTNSIALVNNNIVEGSDTAIAPAAVTLAPASSSIVVSGGDPGFNISIRIMEF